MTRVGTVSRLGVVLLVSALSQACTCGNAAPSCANDRDCSDGWPCANGRCVPPEDGGQLDAGLADAGFECVANEDCPNGLPCDMTVHRCGLMPDEDLCKACTGDSECGGPLDHCLRFDLDGGLVPPDYGCGRACSAAQPCPPGFACRADGARGEQCFPFNAQPEPTCAGVRAARAADACFATDESFGGESTCGAEGFNDSSCSKGTMGALAWCTLKCVPDAGMCPDHLGDCSNGPYGLSCTGRDDGGTCTEWNDAGSYWQCL
ncbi:MAG: hypothetical protein ACYC8T_34810 [Myxococcaceae bacterium]